MAHRKIENSEAIEKKDRPAKLWGLRISTAFVLVILVAITVYIRGVKINHRTEADRVKVCYQQLKETASRIETVKRKRIEFYKNSLLADLPIKNSFAGANFIRRISLIDSQNIKLNKIDIKPGGRNLHFLISGHIEPRGKLSMESTLQRFSREIEAFDDVILIKTQKKLHDTGRAGLPFTITGAIDVQ